MHPFDRQCHQMAGRLVLGILNIYLVHKMIKYIKGSRLRFILFGIFLSIGVFFLCTCLGLLEKNFGNLGLVMLSGLVVDNVVYNKIQKSKEHEVK